MSLVEETAAYLDGPGREESRRLPRPPALAYATESMRLTTRLMQVASWLLLQRAVNEGELTSAQARSEKHRVRLAEQEVACPAEMFEATARDAARVQPEVTASAGARRPSRPRAGRRRGDGAAAAVERRADAGRASEGRLRPLSNPSPADWTAGVLRRRIFGRICSAGMPASEAKPRAMAAPLLPPLSFHADADAQATSPPSRRASPPR